MTKKGKQRSIDPATHKKLAAMLQGAFAGEPQFAWLEEIVVAAGYAREPVEPKKRGRPSFNGELEKTAVRRAEALRLRQEGWAYIEIAEKFGVSKTSIVKDVQRELEDVGKVGGERAREIRTLELARLDKMQRHIWFRVQAGDAQAILTVLRIMERRSRLLGIDLAPEPVQQVVNLLTIKDPKMQVILQQPESIELLHRVTEGLNGAVHAREGGGPGLEAEPGDNGGEAEHELPPLPARQAPE